jgi:hypothetical protein
MGQAIPLEWTVNLLALMKEPCHLFVTVAVAKAITAVEVVEEATEVHTDKAIMTATI